MSRHDRLAALNGDERRTFVCACCGGVKHISKARARVRRSAELVCGVCALIARYGAGSKALRMHRVLRALRGGDVYYPSAWYNTDYQLQN